MDSGRLDAAEDLLYELREIEDAGLHEGLAFYDRLAELPDETLEAGGLSRAELEEGREQWTLLAKETAG